MQGQQDVIEGGPLGGLMTRAAALGGGAAPVHLWHPRDCGPIPLRITADGTWHYNGTPIARERMVRLFASILRREPDGRFVLVTPVEMVGIEVEDAPFAAVEMAVEAGTGGNDVLVLRTNVGDVVRVGADHPLRLTIEPRRQGLVPYVTVRGGLEARLTRAVAAELAERLVEVEGRWGVTSDGVFFAAPAEGDAP
ncbi:MAG: DUF1285 domain-containing protein [Pseudomonadota bacterium]